jgi:hypothetical protein
MELKNMLAAVSNDRVEFVTMRRPGLKFITLGRRVVVTGPPELVELSATGDVKALEELVSMLREHDRAWAAEVLLAAMTGGEEDIVGSFAAIPDEWWDSVGKTAYERWSAWLKQAKEKLVWDSQKKVFSQMMESDEQAIKE